eukprot:TRINITY_DN4120_c0_g1_i1.p1 TRINITY_DN4120_c0_g1~~TRINITY_DN4120_c0_g1_i1.p1  ORF type:complete len:191 (-),score=46.21 TRINITY_DN4120_c0_g1_i1:75-647(-)
MMANIKKERSVIKEKIKKIDEKLKQLQPERQLSKMTSIPKIDRPNPTPTATPTRRQSEKFVPRSETKKLSRSNTVSSTSRYSSRDDISLKSKSQETFSNDAIKSISSRPKSLSQSTQPHRTRVEDLIRKKSQGTVQRRQRYGAIQPPLFSEGSIDGYQIPSEEPSISNRTRNKSTSKKSGEYTNNRREET